MTANGRFCFIDFRQKYLQLPVHAQHATLFAITSLEGDKWSPVASKAFLNLTAEKELCAMVVEISRVRFLLVLCKSMNMPITQDSV